MATAYFDQKNNDSKIAGRKYKLKYAIELRDLEEQVLEVLVQSPEFKLKSTVQIFDLWLQRHDYRKSIEKTAPRHKHNKYTETENRKYV